MKVLKGRSFGNLLGYLFNHQDRPPPEAMEARGSPQEQGSTARDLILSSGVFDISRCAAAHPRILDIRRRALNHCCQG
jgi:hypothetical protein